MPRPRGANSRDPRCHFGPSHVGAKDGDGGELAVAAPDGEAASIGSRCSEGRLRSLENPEAALDTVNRKSPTN